MECHNCNAPVDKEDTFCRNCGHNTKLTDRQCFKCKQFFKSSDLFCGSCGEAVQTKCQKCGSLLELNKKFCTTCGAKLVSQPSIQSTCIKCGNSVVDNEAQLCSQCSALPEEGLRIIENQSSLHPPECAVQNLLNAGNGGAASESDISNTPADCTTDLSSSVTAQNNARTAEKEVSDTRDDSDLELPPNPVIDNKSELTSPMKDGVTIPYDASSPNATSSSQKPTQCTEQESSEDKNASPEVIENDDDSKLPTESRKLNVSAEISKHPILSERKESGTLFEKDLPVGSQDVCSSHSTSTDPPNSFTHSQVQSKDLQQLTNGNELAERTEASSDVRVKYPAIKRTLICVQCIDCTGLQIQFISEESNEDEDIKTSEEISNEDKDKESDNGGNSSEGSNDDTTEHSEPIGKDTGKQQKKKNKPNSRQRKKFQQRGPQAQEQKRKSQKALIAFHVVISSQFKPLQSGDHVFMRWKAENDTKKSAVVILSSSGAQNETGQYYKAEVDRKTLPQNVKFRYYYGIMRDGKEETEKVYTKKKTDCKDDFCRENQLRSTSNQDTFHVYDGVAYPHSMESLIDKVRQSTRIFSSSKDIFARDLVSAPALFLPSPSDICKDLFQSENANHGKSAEQFMQLIKNIVGDISTEPVQTSMKLRLITPLLHSLSILSPNSGNSFTLSMFVYILAKECDIKLSFEELNIIYKGLLIKPASNDKKCQELLILHHHFPNHMKEKRNLAHSLLSCINEDVRDADPSWLYCIPLLHILSDETVPFQEPLPSPEHATPKWWGESKYGKRVKRFKEATESSPWKIPEEQVFEDLKPALRADPLMLRSFVGTLHLDSLLKFLSMTVVPLNIIMASLYFYVKTEPKKVMQNSQTTVLILRNAVSNAREKVRNFRNPSKREAEIVMADTTIAVELLDKIVNNIRLHDIIFPAVILALVHLDLYTRGHFHLHHEYNFPKLYTANHDNAVIFIGGWMKAIRLHQNEASTVLGMVEECIMQCKDIAHEDVQRDLEKAFILNIREVFEKLGTDDRLAACFSLMDFPILSKATNSFHCLEQNIALIFKNDSWHMYDNPRQFIICKQLSRLLEDRYYSIVRSHEEMMVFVFTWTPLNVYLHLRYEAIFMNNLSRDAAAIVFRTSDFVTDLLTRLYTAAVTVSEVKFLFNNREGLFNVVQTVDTHDNGRADYVLQLRFKEVFTFQSLAIEMNCLHKACRKYCITDDADDVIKQTFENNGDIEMKFLRDLLNTWPSQTETISVHEYQPQIRLYGVPYDVNSFLPSVAYHLNSAVFNYMLERNARSMRLSPNNKWWDVIFQLWRQSSDEFTRVSKQITTGNITLEEVQTLFSSLGEDVKWFDYCMKELKKMTSPDNTSWVQERLGQIKCLSDLTVLRDVANIVSSLKQDCEFDGDVNDIETFLKVNMTLQLKDLKPSVVETSCALSVITREEVEYLRQFGSATCAPFIQWVKETMSGDGLQEVKVFVDLALNYVGDKPMEMDKVHNLQAVVTGYAPLIFQTSTRTGTFLDRCYSVCQNIKADPNLPKKLESTVHFLEWFDEIHKFHGSVEKTALAQVESISKRGILKLCKEDILKTKRVHDISLAKVICLEVPEDKESQSSAKTYTYQEMTDLQSRLMLVVGHAEENDKNVERFKSVMDSIERLAKLYVQLCRDGCLLFLDWNVKFFCDQTINVRCITEFFHGKKTNQKFKGLRESHTLEDYIAMVATFLEDCGSQWLTYVAEIRRRFIELNMFTMEQLVFLQEQLVLYENGTLNRHIFQLLSLLRPNCSPDHVQEAMEKASDEVAAKSNVENRENVTVEDNNALIAAQFIKYMCDNGFSRLLASEALSSGIDPTDLDQGIEWCMEHANELGEESQKEDPAEDFQTPSRGGALQILLSRKETIAMALKLLETQGTDAKLSLEAMSTKLNEVWKRFLQTVTYSGEDCLSLEHLGLVLKYLAQQDDRKFERRLPTGLKQGCPNLLLCPKNDVLDVVTSLYMTTQDSPLPQPDEVLLCTPETTFEQVNIFLLRAFSTRSYEKGSLHCMVFADSLDYDNSEKTENQLREYVNTTDHNYQLVVICTKENEFKAHLSAALEKYLCATPVSAKSKILSYLQKKFTICMDIRQDQTAASIDPERVCVRLVKSSRSGMGKTLYKNRLAARLERSVKHKYRYEVDDDSDEDSELKRDNLQTTVTIPLYEKAIDARGVASRLMPYVQSPDYQSPRIIHLDISYEVLEGVDILLYSLLVLGCITDYKGHAWLRSDSDLYLVEAIPLLEHSDDQKSHLLVHQMFNVLPSVTCWSPVDCLSILKKEGNLVFSEWDQVFDDEAFQSDVFQRPVHYLSTIARRQQPKRFTPGKMQTDSNAKQVCLETIINHCGIQSPSWSELYNFVSFLNKQLQDFENSVFCSRPISRDLPGFSAFVLRFVIHMSRDFATRSLIIAEESIPAFAVRKKAGDDNQDLEKFQMRRKWESREERLLKLYRVMGLTHEEMTDEEEHIIDPDTTYELTTDNVKKILAIYMRFRCNIPVVVMGETGCGKTRLVKFMCALQTPKHPSLNTMILMKVHGGTTAQDIGKKVEEAENLAKKIKQEFKTRTVYTVLFFDEANTTEAIGAIKEVMCDSAFNGKPIHLHANLKMVAACNPYKKHTPEVIQRLEKAGLGYHVNADKTRDKLGRLPMRQLVYRVQPLPQSMLPLVWDFGQLTSEAESIYIVHMVLRFIRSGQLGALSKTQISSICRILVVSQTVMREKNDECSFVSLRDADRALTVCSWFLKQHEIMSQLDHMLRLWRVDHITKSLVLALGVCYRAGLRSKLGFDRAIVPLFGSDFPLDGGENLFRTILDSCAELMLENIRPVKKIARNQALKENVFMMVVCVELRIPLFLVGKPGSSKSLAKTLVADAMRGAQSHGELFRSLKEAQVVSFQCSPLSTADGILATFRQCAHIQKGKDKDKFVSVVVLDEVGLAEDSPKMPLKVLHPLLEEGCEVQGIPHQSKEDGVDFDESVTESEQDDVPEDTVSKTYEKVAFIGISNWALDPAKMNRGLLVQRDVPDEEELVQTAESICDDENGVLGFVKELLKKLAKAYLKIFNEAINKKEFFGLRDFYSMVKMVHAYAKKNKRKLTRAEFHMAILRNFGGLDSLDPVDIFEQVFSLKDLSRDVDCQIVTPLQMALRGENIGDECRYLLLLTESNVGLRILEDILNKDHVVPIYGSSFPKDQGYTQICSNINRIKVCMETGKTVILLNLDNLYESLYDALNQSYSILAGVQYVDLGLGSHRVKCKVDKKFRLIVVAEKHTVYEKFPIPLINRLEKHFLTVSNVLDNVQQNMETKLNAWVASVIRLSKAENVGDVFIGFHQDTLASVILMCSDKDTLDNNEEDVIEKIMERCRSTLLWFATPDAIIRSQDSELSRVYFQEQQHDNLAQYLKARLECSFSTSIMAQVTTHSRILTENERKELEVDLPDFKFTLISLQAFQTEQQFMHQLREFLVTSDDDQKKVLIVQCESGNRNQTLLQCAQYCIQSVWPFESVTRHVVFTVQLPRIASNTFMGFQGGKWHCAHIDELRSSSIPLPDIIELQTKSPAQLMSSSIPHKIDGSQRLHVEQEDEEDTNTGLHKDLIHNLVINSVHVAMACVKDREADSDRSMRRITILLQCLEHTNDDTFFRGLWSLMISIIREIESTTPEKRNWLAEDAARLECVKKTGTFRRAWIQSLQNYLVPVLAGVVAFLDTNNNLNFMDSQSDKPHCLNQMWLNMFNNQSLCNLKYNDLLSLSTRQNELQELICRSTFLAGSLPSAELPFSWMISELVDTMLIVPSSELQDDGMDTSESELKYHLQDLINSDVESSDFLHRYASDLVRAHFKLNPTNHQLIIQCLMAAMRQFGLSLEPYDIGRSLLQMHRVLFQVRPRLLAVLDMTACHPMAVQQLQEKLSDPQNLFYGADEMTEDVLLLSMLLEELSPQKDQLNTDKGCQTWLDLFNLVAPVISRVITEIDANLEQKIDLSDGKDANITNCFPYGERCQQQLDSIRCQWMRIAAVKLFIDYMSPLVRDSRKTQLDSKRVNYMLLANLLAKKANLKTKEALLNVDKFLKHANSQMVRGLLGEVGSCMHCTTKLEGPPVLLPCSHRICNKCYTQEAKVGQKCPECLNSIPETFDPDNSDLPNREAVNQLLHYQRQSSSFLMALVSQFCFSGREPPEPDAVEHIFGYIIRREKSTSTIRTQQLTLHDDQIDPSPVLRSFILRLLLQYSEKEVSQHITRFLEDAKSMIQQQVGAERNTASVLTELSLLIIHCIENLQHEKEAIDEKRNDDKAHGLKCKNQCSYIADLLHEVRRVLDSPPLELSTLISMGRLRYALDSCARVLYACVIQPTTEGTLNKDVKDLMMVASYVCEMGSTDWPKKFLIKQLCREFGVETLTILIQRAQQEKCLKWLQLDNIEKIEEVPDRYLLCGENYVSLRTEIMQVIKGIDGELEQNLTLMPCTKRKKEYFILLTLHREVTMACVNENSVAFRAVLQTKAQELVQSANLGIDEDLARRICTNSLGIPGSPLCVDAGQSLAEQSLVCVLTHFWMALRAVEQPNDIALPFITIINQPDSMLTSYLPTMPDDHVEEIAQALAIDPNSAYHHIKNPETPKMYACPNGHRYIIGNCGNPNSQSRCPECGILIGGKAYVPAEGNLQVSTEDRTKPGHTLGPAENRSREAIPERHMSATVCAVLRFLTHASLFLSASQPQQANIVIQMVKPPLPEDKSVVTFFWEHLQLDVQVLARAFHRCCDDVYLLLHALCHYLSERKPVKRRPLTSKSARTKWEKQFCDLIILPILKQAEVIIQQGNQLIVNDTRQGQNQLLNLIFEVGEEDVPDPDKELQHTAVPWKYRTRITVDHFFDNFQLHMEERKGGAKEYPVLKLFQAESLYLRALYYVPDILEHQHRLMQRLRQRLSREEAAKKTVSQALENKECGGLHKLLRAFSTAWDMVKTHLISYRCMTDEGLIQLPAEFHNVTINVSSPLAILLPATRGPGLCSYILIHFLLAQHNSFMEAYCPLVKQRYEQLPEITVQDITKRHLLGYSPQSDLLPLVLGHCNYSLHLGHTGSSAAQLDYDFQGFELQLRNTILLGKSRIAKKENGSLQIETMVYIADTTTSRLFSRLRDKIPQISLSSRVRREIAQDLRGNIPDICQSMDNINTALMYILSLRTDAEKNLCEFMRDTLKMRDTIHSRKAQNHSCLKHVQSLWLLLCMERSAVLASHNQEAFDGQGGDLRKDFQNDQNTALETALKRLKPERLELLLWQLFECIMLRLVQHVGEDFVSPDNYSIHWLVCDNLSESPLYAEPPEETKEELLTEDDLKHFPQSLTASQAIPTWLAIHRHIAARVQQVV